MALVVPVANDPELLDEDRPGNGISVRARGLVYNMKGQGELLCH